MRLNGESMMPHREPKHRTNNPVIGEPATPPYSTTCACSRSETRPPRSEADEPIANTNGIASTARDGFLRCAAILTMTPVALPQAPPVELVQSLFDLTPTEARVARDLAAGKTVETIASGGGVSLNTVRTHVRGVLEKTGCDRQADVVALLTGISSPRAIRRN